MSPVTSVRDRYSALSHDQNVCTSQVTFEVGETEPHGLGDKYLNGKKNLL